MDELSRTKHHRWGLFWPGLVVRLAGLGLIWIGDGHGSLFRKGLVIVGVVLSVGGIAVLRYLLFAPLLSRLRVRTERPPGQFATVLARRPWWKKKRWAAALVLWLLVAYPLSVGPAGYANARGWLRPPVIAVLEGVYEPLDRFVMADLPGSRPLAAYCSRAYRLGERHCAQD